MARTNKIALEISEGIFATFTNLVLFSLFWVGASVGKNGSYGAARAFEEALGEIGKTNYSTIKRAFYHLYKRGLVEKSKGVEGTIINLTKEGEEKLETLLPQYKNNRPVCKEIFMVTYDIPEAKKKFRDRFRRFLESIGCGQLQKSVWISSFNPSRKIASFTSEHQIAGSVIVSTFVKEGSFGDEKIEKIINRAFGLDSLNRRYEEFAKKSAKYKKISGRDYLSFLSILKDDPQLPRQLLPRDWVGEKSYRLTIEKGARIL